MGHIIKALITGVLAATLFFGCKKDNNRIPENYVSKFAGEHTLSGTEHVNSVILYLDSTFSFSIKVKFAVIDNSTIVTSVVDSVRALPVYRTDTLRHVSSNVSAHTVTFQYSQNFIDDGMDDFLVSCQSEIVG